MFKSIKAKIKHWLHGQSNVNQTEQDKPNSTSQVAEMVNTKPIKNTPFHITGNYKTGFYLTMGKYRLTEAFKEPAEVEYYVRTQQYNIMLSIALLVNETQNQINNQTKNAK